MQAVVDGLIVFLKRLLQYVWLYNDAQSPQSNGSVVRLGILRMEANKKTMAKHLTIPEKGLKRTNFGLTSMMPGYS